MIQTNSIKVVNFAQGGIVTLHVALWVGHAKRRYEQERGRFSRRVVRFVRRHVPRRVSGARFRAAERAPRTARRISSAKPVRHVGSRRGSRVAAIPKGDDGGGGSGSEPPAEPAHFAQSLRSTLQRLTLPSQHFFSPLLIAGALMALAALLARWSR